VTALNCSNISKSYGRLKVLNNVSLSINKGELVTLLGPSGCGKTTLLRSIAGLADIDEGSIVLEGRDVTRTPIHKRHIAMVFQSHALFPHMSVADNVAFGLKMQGVARAEREERVKKALSLVRLDAYVSRMPHELSGGQQQRVAIARAIVTNPTALLLDEPFGALDRKLREALQVELRRVTKELGITAIFVTHDQEEAVVLSDRVAVMEGGVIQQIAPANEVYENPANEFVASFMGFQNILDATIEGVADGQTRLRIGDTSVRADARAPSGTGPTRFAIRAERVALKRAQEGEGIAGTVNSLTYLGEQNAFVVDTSVGPIVARISTSADSFKPGDAVFVTFDRSAIRLLNI
jgi:spermidine/putrescine ABC transporter ATP-binding subunit